MEKIQHRRVLAGHHGGDGDASAGMESEEDIDDDTTEIEDGGEEKDDYTGIQ